MSQNLNVALTLSLQDRLSASHARTMQGVRRNVIGVQDAVESLTKRTAAANSQMSSLAQNMNRVVSGLRSMARAVPAAMAAWQAGKFVLREPIAQTQSYDLRLAHMANTAFTDKDAAGRRAGMMQLDASVVGAVQSGGGTREGAAETLDALIASGAFGISDAMKLLPMLQRAATASNSDAKELAQIAITSMQTFGIKREDIGQAIGMAMAAGQMGGFEIKDMAKWLPQQMAAARTSGMSGLADFGRLLASNQAAVLTAGSKDAAGNNLVNLLAKINSQDTANDAKKLGINLSGTLAAARAKGMNPLDAFVALVDTEIVGKNPQYQALRKKAAGAGSDSERRATFDSMADIMQGSAIGKIIQDRQALLQLIAEMEGRGKIKEVVAGAGPSSKRASYATDLNFATVKSTAAFSSNALANESAIAMQTAMNKINPLLGKMADYLVANAQAHPLLAAAITGTTLAATALAASASAASIAIGMLALAARGGAVAVAGGAAAGAIGKTAAGVGIGATAVALLTKAKIAAAMVMGAPSLAAIGSMGATGLATVGAGVVAAGGAGYGLGALINNFLVTPLVEQFIGMRNSMDARDAKPVPVDVTVRVENGNIIAEVQRAQAAESKRH